MDLVELEWGSEAAYLEEFLSKGAPQPPHLSKTKDGNAATEEGDVSDDDAEVEDENVLERDPSDSEILRQNAAAGDGADASVDRAAGSSNFQQFVVHSSETDPEIHAMLGDAADSGERALEEHVEERVEEHVGEHVEEHVGEHVEESRGFEIPDLGGMPETEETAIDAALDILGGDSPSHVEVSSIAEKRKAPESDAIDPAPSPKRLKTADAEAGPSVIGPGPRSRFKVLNFRGEVGRFARQKLANRQVEYDNSDNEVVDEGGSEREGVGFLFNSAPGKFFVDELTSDDRKKLKRMSLERKIRKMNEHGGKVT